MTGSAELLATLTVGRVLADIGHSGREAFSMFWDTLWALVLGFGVSGAVQAFVSRHRMQRSLGNHRPLATVRAASYGIVSSSCSYAASAMAKALVVRGADFVAAMVFMFASTNLVFELGVVLLVLIGWQFVAAEFIGGAIMIGLLVVGGGLWFRGRSVVQARAVAESGTATDSGTVAESGTATDGAEEDGVDDSSREIGSRLRSRAGWADAASYTMSDLRMLRKELVIGFLVAGFLTELVPTGFWNALFVHGHGFWTELENAVVGPLVALLSFVCSIGNVPLAAALWKGGISFGGVVSFVFADLISFPLLLVYRKQYGTRMALRMLPLFWAVMTVAGLVTGYLFRALGWVPRSHPKVIASGAVGLNWTSGLDVLALIALTGLYWLYRNRDRLGGGSGYAHDPVCGMQVEVSQAPALADHEGVRTWFCSEHCRDRFQRDPGRYLAPSEQVPRAGHCT